MIHKVLAGESELSMDTYKKSELMARWIDGSASFEERRQLFTHMLINWLEKSYGHENRWFISEDDCLCMRDQKGSVTRIVQFDNSHIPKKVYQTTPTIGRTISVLLSYFDSHHYKPVAT